MSNQKKVKTRDIIFLQIVLAVYAMGGIFSKRAAAAEFLSFPFLLNYGMVLLILVVYAVLWQQILKRMPLTFAYSNKAVTTIWAIIYGMVIFNEQVTWNMIAGAVIIMIGIGIVSGDENE